MASYFEDLNFEPLRDGEAPDHLLHYLRVMITGGYWRDVEEHVRQLIGKTPPATSKEYLNSLKQEEITDKAFAKERSTFTGIVQPLLVDANILVVDWMKQNSLIRSELKCDSCFTWMNWTKSSASLDGFLWKCQVKECSKYKRKVSIRKDSFFSNSKVKLQQWIHVIYCWCIEMNEQDTSDIVNKSRHTICDFYHSFREVCRKHFEMNPIKLGGPGAIIQIDEACFSHHPKQHRGKEPRSEVWVFGLVDTSNSPAVGYMEVVNNTDQETLLPIIDKVVSDESIIHSKEWKVYRNLTSNPDDSTFNSSLKFVEPPTGVHSTQHIMESYWERHKTKIRNMRGCKRDFLPGYLQQFMWMERNKVDRLINFCRLIAVQYPF